MLQQRYSTFFWLKRSKVYDVCLIVALDVKMLSCFVSLGTRSDDDYLAVALVVTLLPSWLDLLPCIATHTYTTTTGTNARAHTAAVVLLVPCCCCIRTDFVAARLSGCF